MATRTELRGVLKQNQRASKVEDERIPSGLSSKHRGKVKGVRRRDADDETAAKANALGHSCKAFLNESFKRDDELVKYMSKLPGYLQREERGGKVLNIGVLDWGSLEKWKHSQKGGRAIGCNNASSSGPSTSGKTERSKLSTRRISGIVPEVSHHRRKADEQSASCSNLREDYYRSRDLQHSVQRVQCTPETETVSRGSLNKQQKAGFSYKSSGRDHAVAGPGKGRKTQLSRDFGLSLLSDMGNSGVSLGVKERVVVRDGESQKRVEGTHAAEAKQKVLNPEIDAVQGGQSVRSKKLSVSHDTVDRQISKNYGTKKIAEESQESEAGLATRKKENQFGGIGLPRGRMHTRSALPGEFLMSQDDSLGIATPDEFSTVFADGNGNSSELRSLVPRSCPLSLDFERDSGSIMVPLGVDLSSDPYPKELFGRKHSKTASRILDQEKSEEDSRKSRHPSPGNRFSFSFSRLSRSFSFKEDSATQPASSDDSIESDPVRFGSSALPDGSVNPEKRNMHNRVRASPLKRLFEPLLKPKGTENALPSKAILSSPNLKPTDNTVQLQDEKKQAMSKMTTRALVQLTTRNGFPLFQFVVDDSSSSILVATMKSSAPSNKDDSVRYCTFYSVNEMKKKKSGSWLIHGSKEKQRGFVYNMVGQMRMSNSLGSDLTEQKSGNHCPVRESVLLEFELKPSDQATEKAKKASRELAAMVIRRPDESTIILPGGIHSFPNKGAPSPLIDRWRSGGLCDCGGWDVGCKLRVLSNQKRFPGLQECIQLFDQEGTQQNWPAFTMRALKTGMFKVEYESSSMSPLQAFFICVTVITSECEQQQSVSEPRASEEQTKNNRETPLRCSAYNPPLSPVGRV